MKNKYNTLHPYILDNSTKEFHKQTVSGLFRSILEPIISNQSFESCVLFRLIDVKDKQSLIKRLAFSNANIFSFTNSLIEYNIKNIEKVDIWKTVEFVVVVGARYSACLLWDYSLSDKTDYTPVCYLYNSNLISEILRKIADNCSFDINDIVFKNTPDRRENKLLNSSIAMLSNLLNEKNEEVLFSEIEKIHILKNDDKLETAAIVADKAKFVAHEIKNNLSIINLYSKICEKRIEAIYSLPEKTITALKGTLANIMSASENISAHINDLRCLSSAYKTEFDLKKSVYVVVSQCDEKAKSVGVKIYIEDFEDILVISDKIKFECSLLNVIYNAIEACSDSCNINVSCVKEANNVKILVKNNGEKIPDNIQEKIFDADFTTKEKGSGLGLAICKKQLELAGGNINLLYSNDEETLFEITLIV